MYYLFLRSINRFVQNSTISISWYWKGRFLTPLLTLQLHRGRVEPLWMPSNIILYQMCVERRDRLSVIIDIKSWRHLLFWASAYSFNHAYFFRQLWSWKVNGVNRRSEIVDKNFILYIPGGEEHGGGMDYQWQLTSANEIPYFRNLSWSLKCIEIN